jgi:hypothetical protein
MQHAQTKHIDVQHHFVQERVENGELIFENIVQQRTWWQMCLRKHYHKNGITN